MSLEETGQVKGMLFTKEAKIQQTTTQQHVNAQMQT
jgi:hypothetical protein